jgi:hypothetical protein
MGDWARRVSWAYGPKGREGRGLGFLSFFSKPFQILNSFQTLFKVFKSF